VSIVPSDIEPMPPSTPIPGAPPIAVRTQRLLLRPFTDADVDDALAYYGDPVVTRHLLTEPHTRPDAERFVTERSRQVEPRQAGDVLALAVEHDRRVVGDVVLVLVGGESPSGATPSIGEIGWSFHPAWSGKGFATEAARALLDLAFGHYRLHRVKAQLDARNVASSRLCERLGMIREAHLRQDWWSKGEWTDTLVYGLLAGEWPSFALPPVT
jgi:RimJ/RimL family protein N-acetyltransferase